MKKTLSQLATELNQIAQNSSDGHDDVDLFHAPSECHGLVNQPINHELEQFEKRNRIQVNTVLDRIAERTSDKWIYFYFSANQFSHWNQK